MENDHKTRILQITAIFVSFLVLGFIFIKILQFKLPKPSNRAKTKVLSQHLLFITNRLSGVRWIVCMCLRYKDEWTKLPPQQHEKLMKSYRKLLLQLSADHGVYFGFCTLLLINEWQRCVICYVFLFTWGCIDRILRTDKAWVIFILHP